MRLLSRSRRARGGRAGGARGRPPAPFIVGVSRSGTTSLRLALDAHCRLAIPPETHFVPELVEAYQAQGAERDRVVELLAGEPHWPLFGLDPGALRDRLPAAGTVKARAALRAFYGAYAEARGKPRWGDETPGYLHSMRLIARGLPEARFIHVIRDVRDVTLSMVEAGQIKPDALDTAARHWAWQVGKARSDSARLDHYVEIRYEELTRDAEATLRRVCEFVELPWDPATFDALRAAGERSASGAREPGPAGTRPALTEPAGRWRAEMGTTDRATCEAVAGGLLAELGYEIGAPSATLDGILQGRGTKPAGDG